MSSRATIRADELIDLPKRRVPPSGDPIDLSAAFICAEGELPQESTSQLDQIADLAALEYTFDSDMKYAVFQMHAQLRTNFFIRYHNKCGEVLEIDTSDDTIVAQLSDRSIHNLEILNPLLAVEKEEWLEKLGF